MEKKEDRRRKNEIEGYIEGERRREKETEGVRRRPKETEGERRRVKGDIKRRIKRKRNISELILYFPASHLHTFLFCLIEIKSVNGEFIPFVLKLKIFCFCCNCFLLQGYPQRMRLQRRHKTLQIKRI